jgi:2-keto-4-pentenoate hydratase/2-oxohepta-3-ene-1,7-dioic acid hydratase in catechol pathway
MKIFNFYVGDQIHLGAVENSKGVDVTAFGNGSPACIVSLMNGGQAALASIRQCIDEAPALDMESIRFAPAVPGPEKILCVGLNYADHAAEAHQALPETPTLFSKFSSALNAHGNVIRLPKGAKMFDYEAELVIIIGRKASCISKDEALPYIFGYTTGNDFSARDLQGRTTQWLLGKTPDTFAPCGPYIVPADEINISKLSVQSYVNGQLRQDGNTKNMIFDCATIVSYASQFMTLRPGDLIFTGTPQGVIVGYPREKRVWLRAGDEVKIKIEGIGELVNKLVDA